MANAAQLKTRIKNKIEALPDPSNPGHNRVVVDETLLQAQAEAIFDFLTQDVRVSTGISVSGGEMTTSQGELE